MSLLIWLKRSSRGLDDDRELLEQPELSGGPLDEVMGWRISEPPGGLSLQSQHMKHKNTHFRQLQCYKMTRFAPVAFGVASGLNRAGPPKATGFRVVHCDGMKE